MTDRKIEIVQGLYEAFGRGDIDHIVGQLTDDVDWASCPDSDVAPWHGIHRGRAEVPSFFKALTDTLEITEFTPLSFASNETDVMVVTRWGATAPATGKSAAMDIHHWWRFRGDKICFYRGTEDIARTADMLSARGIFSPALLDGLGAGVAFGLMFIGLAQAGPGSGHSAGLWPVASEQTGSLLLVLAVAAKTRVPLRAAIRAAGWPVLVGAGGMTATLLYFYATHFTMLATAAVLVSLYPGVTVLLARTVLHERFSLAQRAGLGLCTLAVIAIALN